MSKLESINFNAHHSPMGAYMSFTCGHFGTRGGIGTELGGPAQHDLFIGFKEGDRKAVSPLRCLPFFRNMTRSSAADYLVEQAGPSEQRVSPNVVPIDSREISRSYGWATDRWTAPGLEFTIYTPFAPIPDPESAACPELRESLVPGVFAELTIDNSAGSSTRTAVFAIGFNAAGVRVLDNRMGNVRGFALHDRIGFAGSLVEEGHLILLQRWDIAEAIGDANPVHQLGTCAGFAFDVPAGERRTLRLAVGCYLGGVVTTRTEARYLYTRYFSCLEEVLGYLLDPDRFIERRSAAKAADREMQSSRLSSDQQFLLSHATRGYYANTQLLDVAGKPIWIVNEGEYCMMNTLDLSIDQAFWELQQNPWVVRNVLDSFCRDYSYIDDAGLSFTHDVGAHNNFSAPGTSSYEMPHLKGCFSYMTQEQLCNWILLAACYVARTRDAQWLSANAHLLDACAASMHARANPRTGVMSHDSSRCLGGWEITTYDSLDPSLGQARANLYLAVKCWATWLGLEMLAQMRDVSIDSLAGKIADHLVLSADAQGVLPAVLETGSAGASSRILPAIEGLVYPAYWLAQAPQRRPLLARALKSPLVQTLRRHTLALLNDPQRRNIFEDGGIKLSSTSSNSWMSKIHLFEFVARDVLHLQENPQIARLLESADSAHCRWQIEGSAYWACSDQFVSGVAKASRYYPRLITAYLWMTENRRPVIEVTIPASAANAPAKEAQTRQ